MTPTPEMVRAGEDAGRKEIGMKLSQEDGRRFAAAAYRAMARAQPPQPTRTLKGMIADIYEGMDAEDCAMIDKAWCEFRSPSQPTGDVEGLVAELAKAAEALKGWDVGDLFQRAHDAFISSNSRTPKMTQERIEAAAKAIFWCMNSVMHDHDLRWSQCIKKNVYRDCARAALSPTEPAGRGG